MVKKVTAVNRTDNPKKKKTIKTKTKPAPAQVKKVDGGIKAIKSKGESKTLEQQLAQREDELAILNSVGEAMAKTFDVKTVTRIVGDKVRDIFKAEVTEILLLDPIP